MRAFPAELAPVQVDDSGRTITEMGRPALRVQVSLDAVSVDVVSVHLKSKLLSFPGGRFAPRDEDERARYAVYGLQRRAAEAAGVRAFVTRLLAGQGQERSVIVAGDLNDVTEAATTQILLGPPARSGAHPAMTGRTRATATGCGISRRGSRRGRGTRGSTAADSS